MDQELKNNVLLPMDQIYGPFSNNTLCLEMWTIDLDRIQSCICFIGVEVVLIILRSNAELIPQVMFRPQKYHKPDLESPLD